jgi:hypothetical protein
VTYRPRALSHSQIVLYRRCPAAYHARYVLREPAVATPALCFGRAVSKGLEAVHAGDDWRLAFRAAYAREDWQLRASGSGVRPGVAYGLDLLGLYAERPYAGIPERKFVLHLPTYVGVPVPIVGYLDLDAWPTIVEYKASAATWDEAKARKELQAPAYWWAGTQLHGRAPERILYVILSTNAPGVAEFDVAVRHEDLRAFEAAAREAWDGIVAGKFDACGTAKCDHCAARAARPARLRCRKARDGEDVDGQV